MEARAIAILLPPLRDPVRRAREESVPKEGRGKEGGGVRDRVLLRGWVIDVTGIAIANYAMFLFFFFFPASRSALGVSFLTHHEVPNGAYATIAAFLACARSVAPIAQRCTSRVNRFDLEAALIVLFGKSGLRTLCTRHGASIIQIDFFYFFPGRRGEDLLSAAEYH